MRFFLIRLLLTTVTGYCLAFTTPAHAQDNASAANITWYYSDFAPISIVSGASMGKGYMDRVLKLLAERLPGYHHTFVQGNTMRKLSEIKQQQNTCTEMLKTAERETYVEYSLPVHVILPNGVVTKRKNVPRFQPYMDVDGHLSLEKALQQTGMKLGISSGRSYSEGIDAALKKHSDQPNVITRAGQDLTRGLLQMLINDRLDYALMFPIEMTYITRELEITEELVFIPVVETPSYLVDYIGCPKNAWGKKVIREVNTVLEKSNQTEIPAFYSYWLDGASRARHRHFLKLFYATKN